MEFFDLEEAFRKCAIAEHFHIPDDLITGILAYLPVRSLLRLRCLSKHWASQIQSRWFIAKHYTLTKPKSILFHDLDNKEFIPTSTVRSLLLESHTTASNKDRIRNPETRQVLYLPAAEDNGSICCKVFNASTVSIDEKWRILELQEFYRDHDTWMMPGPMVVYFVQFDKNRSNTNMKVNCLHMASDCFYCCTLPQRCVSDMTELRTFWYEKSLAFCCEVEEDYLKVVLLEDYMTDKWREEKIHLKVLKENLVMEEEDKLFFCYIRSNRICFLLNGTQYIWDTRQRTFTAIELLEDQNVPVAMSYFPSLITLKGMQPENHVVTSEGTEHQAGQLFNHYLASLLVTTTSSWAALSTISVLFLCKHHGPSQHSMSFKT